MLLPGPGRQSNRNCSLVGAGRRSLGHGDGDPERLRPLVPDRDRSLLEKRIGEKGGSLAEVARWVLVLGRVVEHIEVPDPRRGHVLSRDHAPVGAYEVWEGERRLGDLRAPGDAKGDLRVLGLVARGLQRDGLRCAARLRALREELVQGMGRPQVDRHGLAPLRPMRTCCRLVLAGPGVSFSRAAQRDSAE